MPASCREVREGAGAFAAGTASAADDATPAPIGTSDAMAIRTEPSRGTTSRDQSSRRTPATYAAHPFGSSSCHLTRTILLNRVETASSTPHSPAAPGPAAAVVRAAIAIGSTGPPL